MQPYIQVHVNCQASALWSKVCVRHSRRLHILQMDRRHLPSCDGAQEAVVDVHHALPGDGRRVNVQAGKAAGHTVQLRPEQCTAQVPRW